MYHKTFPKKLLIHKRNKNGFNEESYKFSNKNPFIKKTNKINLNKNIQGENYNHKKGNNQSLNNQGLNKILTVKQLNLKKIIALPNIQNINSNDNIFIRKKNNFINENISTIDIKNNDIKYQKIFSNSKYIENNRIKLFRNQTQTTSRKKKGQTKYINGHCKNINLMECKINLLNNNIKNLYKSNYLKSKASPSDLTTNQLNYEINTKEKNKQNLNDKKINKKIVNNNILNKEDIVVCKSEMNLFSNHLTKKNKMKNINNNKNNENYVMKNNNISNNRINKTRNTNPKNISFLLSNEKKEEPNINKFYGKPIKRTYFREFVNLISKNNSLFPLDSNSKTKDYESKFLNYELGQTNGLSKIPESLICSFNSGFINPKNNEKATEYEKSSEEIYKTANRILDSNRKLKKAYLNKKVKDYNYAFKFWKNIDELKEGENINRIINLYNNCKY